MWGALFLGWRYLAHHRVKSCILVASITLMVFLPSATRLLVEDSAAALTSRAELTPLVLGAGGGDLELVLNTLYFSMEVPPPLENTALATAQETGLATFIPINVQFHAQGAPVVGTNLDYFTFRNLELADGRHMGLLGEAVIGAAVAAERGLGPGDHVISSPESVFDLAGVYPLKMPVVGVLRPTGTTDDQAIFVDLRTTWVIEGLGHGHMDLQDAEAGQAVLTRNDETIVANASLRQYSEITPDNIGDFHFHGSSDGFPLTGIIAIPPDHKNNTLLQGRYQDHPSGLKLVVPGDVLDDLLETVFTVQNYVVLALAILGLATIAVVTLVFLLSQQLRRGEFHTLSRIGASRAYIGLLVASEVGFVFILSVIFALALTMTTRHYATQIMQSFLSL